MKFRVSIVAATVGLLASAAHATNGYFSHGYGMKAKGMGGAGVTSTDNAFAGANNPAAAALAGNRYDLGLDLFSPDRSAAMYSGTETKSANTSFLIPEFGYNKVSGNVGYGVTVYGNGGMNTEYSPNFFSFGTAAAKVGVNLNQLIVAPTYAIKLSDQSSLGLSPLLVYQQFSATGLSDMGGFSASPNSMSDKGVDSSTGLGLRVGFLHQLSPDVRFGMSYSPKTKMSKLDKYKGLFAGEGGFDIPANATIGISISFSLKTTMHVDYQTIQYSGVPSIGNSGTNGQPFGSTNGAGFGWKDVNVLKIGFEHKFSPTTTLRVGYNKGTNPIDPTQVTLNSIAPGVVTTHYTLGATYATSNTDEITWAFMYAPEVSVSGPDTTGAANGTTDTIRMKQYSIGMQYSKKF